MSLRQLLAAQDQYPCLSDIGFTSLTTFLRMACLARPIIELQVEDRRRPPDFLHCGLLELLAATVSEPNLALVQTCWVAFKDIIWSYPEVVPTEEEIRQYSDAALSRGTSFGHLVPPVRVCQDSYCPNYRNSDDIMTLKEPLSHKATLYTLPHRSIVAVVIDAIIQIMYHVKKSTAFGTYYGGVSRSVQVAQDFYIESPLLELFANGMVFGWLSSSNWARIYNAALARTDSHILNNKIAFASQIQPPTRPIPDGWNLEVRPEDVLNGLFLYSLLLDKAERRSILILPHDESTQKGRLGLAIAERNKAMEGIGQEAYPHAYNLCFFVFEDENGNLMKIQTVHCDGDTIGHRCCKAHDCNSPLPSNRQHFCLGHQHLKLKCAVTDCDLDSAKNHRTCDHPDHRALETAYFTRGKSIHKLRSRMRKAGVAVPADSMPSAEDDVMTTTKSRKEGTGASALTLDHNEQLIMRSCGVILSRATLFGSEAVSAVNDFAKANFPSPESNPEFFIFDNNCKLDAHQRAIGDHHFDNTGKPVDVFHFTCKHKLTDTHCQLYCNPAAFRELLDEHGNWRFNTSICEQTNVWFGGYIAVVLYIIKELGEKGHNPWTIPMAAIFPTAY
ncbi:hypothetical protein R3P38DRAFT_3231659 [Favolaschia claudopus]|uniref:CxC6 like cysteine cluster associated with KDZ domain-containing protein n=1 Tax=Favolaschia claudopus TaxID=2862362 RepID=A0AAV9ZJP9_9AGAR